MFTAYQSVLAYFILFFGGMCKVYTLFLMQIRARHIMPA